MKMIEAFKKNKVHGTAFTIRTNNLNNGSRVNVLELTHKGVITEEAYVYPQGDGKPKKTTYVYDLENGTVNGSRLKEGQFINPSSSFALVMRNGNLEIEG